MGRPTDYKEEYNEHSQVNFYKRFLAGKIIRFVDMKSIHGDNN